MWAYLAPEQKKPRQVSNSDQWISHYQQLKITVKPSSNNIKFFQLPPKIARSPPISYCKIKVVFYEFKDWSITTSVTWASNDLKSTTCSANNLRKIPAPHYWSFLGRSMGDWLIPVTRPRNPESVSMPWHHHAPIITAVLYAILGYTDPCIIIPTFINHSWCQPLYSFTS